MKFTRVNGVIAAMFVADFSPDQKILRRGFDLNVARLQAGQSDGKSSSLSFSLS